MRQMMKQAIVAVAILLAALSVARQAGGETARAQRPADTERAARSVLLVPLAPGPSWQDMAFLAAVPAAMAANDGKPALIALPASGEIGRETEDYLRRYKPTVVYTLGGTVEAPGKPACPWRALPAGSAAEAAGALSRTFWKASETVVVCPVDDYGAALIASTLAGRLGAPLLFRDDEDASAGAAREAKRLGARRAIAIGSSAKATDALKKQGVTVTELADAKAVLAWMRKNDKTVTYIAAVNPTDRSAAVIKKLSLAGALLAAARQGMVVPLAYDMRWKIPFTGEPCKGDLPKGIPAKTYKTPPRQGLIELDGRKAAFVTTGGPKAGPHRIHIDLDGDGAFDGAGEGPLATADTVELGGKSYAITLGEASGVGKAQVRLTYPSAQSVRDDLLTYYAALGGHPDHLCLVGFPDAIPQAIIPREPGAHGDLLSDLPYANADDDPFVEIGVARLIAEDVQLATLYAARVLTYSDLLDPEWQDSMGQARWENTYWPLFENVGFTRQFRHDVQDLKWLKQPGPGPKDRGKREQEFNSDSSLTHVAAITHMAHSWWKDLGQTYSWDSTVLLAPTLVESGGCLTASLDRDAGFRSVIARLLRNGAVGFVGNIRPGMANQEQQRAEFWNGVLAGRTIGQAHRNAQNSMILTVLDNDQLGGGYHHYSLYIRTLFGDPAVAMRVPSPPRSAPARVAVQSDTVSVQGPTEWSPVSIRVPEDWKKWSDKQLYVCRGAGTYPVRRWCREEYDREETYCNAELHTDKRIEKVTQVQDLPKPLGWNGKYWADEHADGTRTYRWRVRLIDFDQLNGKIVSQADRVDYRIAWQSR